MSAALSALLDGIIDYAGLFPPAKLDLETALRTYFKHLKGPEKWLVSRFVCPAGELTNLGELLKDYKGEPVLVTVIGSRATSVSELRQVAEQDAEAIQTFHGETDGAAEVQAYETRAIHDVPIGKCVDILSPLAELDVFLEVPWSDHQVDDLHAIAEHDWLGAKGRTGGLVPPEFPSASALAVFLHECMSLDLRFKLTAGMHHPLRHYDALIGAHQHGFLNVACAATLIEAMDFSKSEVEEVLLNENPGSFVFGSDSFAYNNLEVDLASIEDMRSLFLSYGSCSVEDPILGLASLGLIQVGSR
ncbi:MAG TPA: hypothetical protein PKA27_03035 [Fimbriimonadaceae bacterium]|mgnify:CR=1 FL=1|nr:hypothetical protein [Fimbriimonadaceae bacterium]